MNWDYEQELNKLSKSKFRSKFHLSPKMKKYVEDKGIDVIKQHAYDFVSTRLAPAIIPNDGKQTPWDGHPVFVAQHATGCCCRGCLMKWHHIPKNRELTKSEQDQIVNLMMYWINNEMKKAD